MCPSTLVHDERPRTARNFNAPIDCRAKTSHERRMQSCKNKSFIFFFTPPSFSRTNRLVQKWHVRHVHTVLHMCMHTYIGGSQTSVQAGLPGEENATCGLRRPEWVFLCVHVWASMINHEGARYNWSPEPRSCYADFQGESVWGFFELSGIISCLCNGLFFSKEIPGEQLLKKVLCPGVW